MSPQPAITALSLSQPVPPPRRLPAAYRPRSGDDELTRAGVRALVSGVDWSCLPWLELTDWLLGVGRADIPLSRLAEGHIDAVRIAAQAHHPLQPGALYGVWASKSGGSGVSARPVDRGDGEGWILDGEIRFASGAGLLDRALVPVQPERLPDADRADHAAGQLLVDLDVRDLPVDDSAWRTTAMAESRSHTVHVAGVTVEADAVVGPPGFYLDREGFFPGGVGVAAVWAGGAARVTDLLLSWLGERTSPVIEQRLGRIRVQLTSAVAVVRQTGVRLDGLLTPLGEPRIALPDGHLQQIATEARAAVAHAVRAVLEEARTLAGAAGIAFDEPLTRALDDLSLYALQQNTDGDAGFLGSRLRPPTEAGTA